MPKPTNEIATRSALASTEIGAAPVVKLLLGVEVTINSTTINLLGFIQDHYMPQQIARLPVTGL